MAQQQQSQDDPEAQALETARQRLEQARQAAADAETQFQALPSDSQAEQTQLGTHRSQMAGLNAAVRQAQEDYNQALAGYRRVHPVVKQQTPAQATSQQAAADAATRKNQEIARNQAETGIAETDVQRAAREDKNKPKPPRQDSPAQQQTAQAATQNAATSVVNAQTNAQNAAERGRHDVVSEQNTVLGDQIRAQQIQAQTAVNMRNQISREGYQQASLGMKGIDEARAAATTLMTAETQRNGQQVDLTKARATMINGFMNNLMIRGMAMAGKIPKGSDVVTNWARGMVAAFNSAYHNAGLDQGPPALSPAGAQAVRTLTHIAGLGEHARLPTLPTSDQIGWKTAAQMAFIGFPLDGWNGPIGVDALPLLQDPVGAQQAAGQQVDPIVAASKTPEGAAILSAAKASVAAIEAKPENQRTPEEQQQLTNTKTAALQQLRQLATTSASKAQNPQNSQANQPTPTTTQPSTTTQPGTTTPNQPASASEDTEPSWQPRDPTAGFQASGNADLDALRRKFRIQQQQLTSQAQSAGGQVTFQNPDTLAQGAYDNGERAESQYYQPLPSEGTTGTSATSDTLNQADQPTVAELHPVPDFSTSPSQTSAPDASGNKRPPDVPDDTMPRLSLTDPNGPYATTDQGLDYTDPSAAIPFQDPSSVSYGDSSSTMPDFSQMYPSIANAFQSAMPAPQYQVGQEDPTPDYSTGYDGTEQTPTDYGLIQPEFSWLR